MPVDTLRIRFIGRGLADRVSDYTHLVDVLPELVSGFQFGSLALAQNSDAKTWSQLALHLKERGVFIGVDVNVRLALTDDLACLLDRFRPLLPCPTY